MTAPTTPKKRSPADAWKALEERWADDDEAERIAALTPEELDRELATLGVDVEGQREKGRAFAAEVKRVLAAKSAEADERSSQTPEPASGGAAPAVPQTLEVPDRGKVVPLRRISLVWILAAAFVLVCIGVAAIAGVFDHHEPGPPPRPDQPYQPPTAPPPPPESRAAADAALLVQQAKAACARKDWAACNARLDEAEQRDPNVANDPEVQTLRAELERKKAPPDGG